MIQAEYLNRQFKVEDNFNRTIKSVELSRGLRTELKETKEGAEVLKVLGYEGQSFTVEYPCSDALGTTPYIEYQEWRRKEGKKGVFLLGNQQFGAGDFLLKSVEMSGVKLANNGNIVFATIRLELVFDDVKADKGKSKKGKGKKDKKGVAINPSDRDKSWKQMYGKDAVKGGGSNTAPSPDAATKKELTRG